MEERRSSARMRRLKSGRILFNKATSVYDCTVRNVSDHGACLEVVNPLMVPASFDLLSAGERRSCAVAWRSPDRIGVKYQ